MQISVEAAQAFWDELEKIAKAKKWKRDQEAENRAIPGTYAASIGGGVGGYYGAKALGENLVKDLDKIDSSMESFRGDLRFKRLKRALGRDAADVKFVPSGSLGMSVPAKSDMSLLGRLYHEHWAKISPRSRHTVHAPHRSYPTLAHELGHAVARKRGITRHLQKARLGGGVVTIPLAAAAASADPDSAKAKALNAAAIASIGVPVLGDEAVASLKASKLLKKLRISPENLKLHNKALKKAWGTYALGVAGLGVGLEGARIARSRAYKKVREKDSRMRKVALSQNELDLGLRTGAGAAAGYGSAYAVRDLLNLLGQRGGKPSGKLRAVLTALGAATGAATTLGKRNATSQSRSQLGPTGTVQPADGQLAVGRQAHPNPLPPGLFLPVSSRGGPIPLRPELRRDWSYGRERDRTSDLRSGDDRFRYRGETTSDFDYTRPVRLR
jgi:hypothetical protein